MTDTQTQTDRIYITTYEEVQIHFNPANGQFEAQPSPSSKLRAAPTLTGIRSAIAEFHTERGKEKRKRPSVPVILLDTTTGQLVGGTYTGFDARKGQRVYVIQLDNGQEVRVRGGVYGTRCQDSNRWRLVNRKNREEAVEKGRAFAELKAQVEAAQAEMAALAPFVEKLAGYISDYADMEDVVELERATTTRIEEVIA